MDLMRFFKAKPKTSSLAKERLQLILAHERIGEEAKIALGRRLDAGA